MTKPLEAYAEKAFSLVGGKLPEIVYLPPSLRSRTTSQDPSTEDDDQLDRIVKADPLGFLFAIMQGKALASFTIKTTNEERPTAKRLRGRPKKETVIAQMKLGEENGHAYYAEFHSPSVADRERVAMFLSKFIAKKRDERGESRGDEDEFALLCATRAAEAKASNDDQECTN
jgi:hypothetical protein